MMSHWVKALVAVIAVATIAATAATIWARDRRQASSTQTAVLPAVGPGLVVGWGDRMYRITAEVPSSLAGKELGEAVDHGNLGEAFRTYRLKFVPTSKAIVVQVLDGPHWGPDWEARATTLSPPVAANK